MTPFEQFMEEFFRRRREEYQEDWRVILGMPSPQRSKAPYSDLIEVPATHVPPPIKTTPVTFLEGPN
jgi:hypothetical protein